MTRICKPLKFSLWCLALGLMFGRQILAADPGIGSNTFEALSYESSGYRFLTIGPSNTPPAAFEQPGFDDSAFDNGRAAFGSGGACPLQTGILKDGQGNVLTTSLWPTNTQLLLRKVVRIPAHAFGVRVMVSVDNDVLGIFFNGRRVPNSNFTHESCPSLDDFRVDVPRELIVAGENLVVFQVLDRGVESFFDARILAECGHKDNDKDNDKDKDKDKERD